jgi:hypothetical protein
MSDSVFDFWHFRQALEPVFPVFLSEVAAASGKLLTVR